MEEGIGAILDSLDVKGVVARQGSAFCVYFMDHEPRDWHDLAENHDFEADVKWRQALIERGVYIFPEATKQCSISAAHTEADITFTLEQLKATLQMMISDGSGRLRISQPSIHDEEHLPSEFSVLTTS
jgi:glutamate-1-semialdehyde 2,1-aminomutase